MQKTKNPVTGNDVLVGAGILKSVSDRVFENANGTPLRIAVVNLPTKDGRQDVSAIMNENNFKYGVTIGESYQTRVEKIPGQSTPVITVSHLPAGERIDVDAFEWDDVDFVAPRVPDNVQEIRDSYAKDRGDAPVGSRSAVPVNQAKSQEGVQPTKEERQDMIRS